MTKAQDKKDPKSLNSILYAEYKNDLLVRQLSNSEKYDAAILTLSMAALGVSLAFMKDIVSPENAINLWALKLSWVMFGLSIVLVVFSFRASNNAISKQIDYGYNYYILNNDKYANKRSFWTTATTICNHISGLVFIIAVALTIYFVTININPTKEMNMSDRKELKTRPIKELIEKGADIPSMQPKKPLSEGADIPNMQPAEPIDTTGSDQSTDKE